jgi:hypothetical protein
VSVQTLADCDCFAGVRCGDVVVMMMVVVVVVVCGSGHGSGDGSGGRLVVNWWRWMPIVMVADLR